MIYYLYVLEVVFWLVKKKKWYLFLFLVVLFKELGSIGIIEFIVNGMEEFK